MYPYGDPTVLAQAREATIKASRLLDGQPNTLFIVSPANYQDRLRPLFTTLIAEMIDEAMTRATSSPTGRLDPPLLVIVDDVSTCVPPAQLDQLASVGAGLGIQLLTLFQDLGQVERAVGSNQAIQLADDHRARVALPGISDAATVNYMNSLVRGSRMGATAGDGGPDPSAAWLRTLEDGEAVCVYGNLPPVKMELRYWYQDSRLRERVEPPVQPARRRRLRTPRAPSEPAMRGFPNPFDSDANDREAARYWDAVQRDGVLPEPLPYDEGSGNDDALR
jgi:type IV secretory pathway TraG/TraD family ATPase VirD4